MGIVRFGTWLSESLKFAATVLVWLGLKKVAPDFQGSLADAVSQIIAALVAGFITFAALDIALGRPLIQLVWKQADKSISSRRPDLGLPFPRKRVLRVEVLMEGRTPIASFADWVARKYGLRCVVKFRPLGTVRCVHQGGPDGAMINENMIIFDLAGGMVDGALTHIEFSVAAKHTSMSVNRVDCILELQTKLGSRFWLHRLVRRDCGIDGFSIGGA